MLKSTLLVSLFLSLCLNFAHANTLENALIEGVKFLDDVPGVEWYRVDGRTLIIGWKGIPRVFPHTNRKAARRATIATGKEIHVWAVRHNQRKWSVGSGISSICSVLARNGRVQSDTCS
ncbi:MAG: hypothetical protein H8E42_03175 [Nitrospinae bacterium]|nr:hypothetical protein [Nitrospinota bacterium]MBL7019342.1 hypothetical protein [Nitrospinaceae bacterium]